MSERAEHPRAERIGLYGGAFDPPHAAHLAVARTAIDQLALDRLIIVPTGDAWHKAQTLSPAPHRLAMAQAVFADLPQAQVDDRETRRSGPSYTIDTVRELQAAHPGARWFLVIGADQAAGFSAWKDWQTLLDLTTVAVAPRGGIDAALQPANCEALLAPERWSGHAVHALQMQAWPHSATSVREQLAAGARVTDLPPGCVPEPVARYIERHHLYSPT